MSVSEVAARGARQARFAVERLGALRVDHPPPPSAWPPPAERPLPVPMVSNPQDYIAAADRIVSGRFDFFGESFMLGDDVRWNVDPKTRTEAPLSFGKTLNYRDTRLVGDIKYLWELNRHLEVVTLAQAYALTSDRRYLDHLRRLITSWIRQCPYPLGPELVQLPRARYTPHQLAARVSHRRRRCARCSSKAAKGNGLPRSGCGRYTSTCISSWVICPVTRPPTTI